MSQINPWFWQGISAINVFSLSPGDECPPLITEITGGAYEAGSNSIFLCQNEGGAFDSETALSQTLYEAIGSYVYQNRLSAESRDDFINLVNNYHDSGYAIFDYILIESTRDSGRFATRFSNYINESDIWRLLGTRFDNAQIQYEWFNSVFCGENYGQSFYPDYGVDLTSCSEPVPDVPLSHLIVETQGESLTSEHEARVRRLMSLVYQPVSEHITKVIIIEKEECSPWLGYVIFGESIINLCYSRTDSDRDAFDNDDTLLSIITHEAGHVADTFSLDRGVEYYNLWLEEDPALISLTASEQRYKLGERFAEDFTLFWLGNPLWLYEAQTSPGAARRYTWMSQNIFCDTSPQENMAITYQEQYARELLETDCSQSLIEWQRLGTFPLAGNLWWQQSGLGQAYSCLGQCDRAINIFDQIISQNEEFYSVVGAVLLQIAATQESCNHDLDAAIAAYWRMYDEFGNFLGRDQLSEDLSNIIRILVNEANACDAAGTPYLEIMEDIYEECGDCIDLRTEFLDPARFLVGHCYWEDGNCSSAISPLAQIAPESEFWGAAQAIIDSCS